MPVNQVEHQGLVLPPPGIPRHGGTSDEEYLLSAKDNVRRAEELAGLRADDRVLDIGCGAGRFLTGLLATHGRVNRYVGLDVRKPVIDWCSAALTRPEYGDVRFEWINVENPRYNKTLDPETANGYQLPVADGSMDLAVLFSVFTHMTFEDTAAYLGEIERVLDRNGRCYCTAFVEDGVERWAENPADYLQDWLQWQGPLRCARFDRAAFEGIVADAGLRVVRYAYRYNPTNRQSAYVLARP